MAFGSVLHPPEPQFPLDPFYPLFPFGLFFPPNPI